MKPTWLGISAGVLLSLVLGLVYFVVLSEPGSAFYLFAGLTFLGGSLMGGTVAGMQPREHRIKAFLTAGTAVFGVVFALFVVLYMIVPQFDRGSVRLPDFCNGLDGGIPLPAQLTYTLPDQTTGIRLIADRATAVVARVDASHTPFPTRVFIVSQPANKILQSMTFPDDVVSAAIGEGTVYIYNDKIGLFFDAHTGNLEKNFFTIDNYGGLSQTDRPVLVSGKSSGQWYLETTAVVSSWNIDGTVVSRPHLTFNGIALGCFVTGGAHEVTRY